MMEVIGWMVEASELLSTDRMIDRYVWSTEKDKAYRVSLRNTPQVLICVLFSVFSASGVGLRKGMSCIFTVPA